MFYRSEIDGLRALAVIPVIFFHAGFNFFGGGFVGVDVFYVISGYLISGLIFKEIETDNFNLLNFYERRARRLLPSLFFIMLVITPIAFLLLVPSDLADFLNSLAAVSTFSSNIYFLLGMDGYFSEASELKPLLHTWSLAVEEQYYLLFPLFILLTWGFGQKFIISSLSIIFILSLSLSYWGSYNHPSAAFYLLPTRGWELLLGVFAAFYLKTNPALPSKFFQNFLGFFGLSLIILAIISFNNSTLYPGLNALAPTIGTLLIILFARQDNTMARLLSHKVLVGIGLISYSAYLWHVPLFAFARNMSFQSLGLCFTNGLILMTFLLAYLTWRFVENPFRNRSVFSSKAIWLFSITCSLLFIVFGLVAAKNIKNIELSMANDLLQNQQIVSADIDERLFIKYRIMLERMDPELVVIGSSRMMQIGENVSKVKTLNLSVSNASLEDSIAIMGLAQSRFKPKTIIMGLDPWMIDKNSGRTQWETLQDEYYDEIKKLTSLDKDIHLKIEAKRNESIKQLKKNNLALQNLYLRGYESEQALPTSYKDITKKDGSRVYNKLFQNRSRLEIAQEFDGYLNHSIDNYERSPEMIRILQELITYYGDSKNIIFMITPYHPDLYNKFLTEKPILLEVEDEFRELAKLNNIKIIGSYNPKRNSCDASEFYDGIHPRGSCVEKILKELVL